MGLQFCGWGCAGVSGGSIRISAPPVSQAQHDAGRGRLRDRQGGFGPLTFGKITPPIFSLAIKYNIVINNIMNKETLKDWRKGQGLTRKALAGMLGITPMALAYWEWGSRGIPALLPLALEALEHRMQGGKYKTIGGMPGVQGAE